MAKKEQTIFIKVGEGFPPEKAIRKFKRLCDFFGVVKEYRKREQYDKPSVQAKEKREAAEKRRMKDERRKRKSYSKI